MLDLIGEAAGYLSAPAGRARWQDTWTMKRTRREAMGQLAGTYASWLRTVCGALVTAVALGGAFLLGRGVIDLSGAGGLVAVLAMVGGVVLLLAGLAGAGYVLFTGTRLVGALRTWSVSRADDGGPGVGTVLTPAVVVRLVLALLALAAGVGLVLVRTGVLSLGAGPFTGGAEQDSGQGLWQWFAAVIAIGSGLAAGSGAVRAGLAVRRRPRRAKPGRGPGAEAQQQHAPQQGVPAAPAGMATPAGTGTAAATGTAAGTGRAGPAGAGTGVPGAPLPPETAATSQPEPVPTGSPRADPDEPPPAVPGPPPVHSVPTAVPQGPGAPAGAPAAQEPAAPAQEPSTAALPDEEEWAATRKVSDLPTATTASTAAISPLRAVLPDGRTVTTDGLTLLGRSPAGRTGEQVAGTLSLDDAAVSKTHLAIRLAGGHAWATDRASTNGSVLVRGGEHETLTAWDEVPLAPGDQLLLGTSLLRIEAAES